MSEITRRREVIFNFLDRVGNHERKIGAAALLLADPSRPFTVTELTHEINDHQGAEAPWPIVQTTTEGYIKTGLLPIGAAVRTRKRVRGSPTYSAAGKYQEMLRTMIGFEVKWSLDNPDFSVQPALGVSSGSGQAHSPRTRYQLYGAILAQAGQSITQLGEGYKSVYCKSPEAVSVQLDSLRSLGIIAIDTTNDYNPILEVTHEMYAVRTPEAEQLQEFLKTLSFGAHISLKDLFTLLRTHYPDSDFSLLRNRMIDKMRHSSPFKESGGLRLIDEPTVPEGDVTRVTLSPHVAPAIAEFRKQTEKIIEGEINRGFTKSFRQVVEKESVFAALVAKAKRFSTHNTHRGAGNELKALISSVLVRGEWQTAQDVHEGLRVIHNRQVSMVHLHRVLRNMASDGQLRGSQDLQRGRKTNFYTLPPELG